MLQFRQKGKEILQKMLVRVKEIPSKIRDSFCQNPLVYLFRKTWHYSKGNHKSVVCFWSMFVVSECITLFIHPIIWAKIFNIIQQEGVTEENISTLLMLIGSTMLVIMTAWAFHGPARVLERYNAFTCARLNYRKYLLKGVMTLPLDWHTDHHSGDTIDKIEKGTVALNRFSETTFIIIYSVIRFVGSYCVLTFFYGPSAFIVAFILMLIIGVVIGYDKILIKQYKELNRSENKITASIFDSVSNITTIIILRVEPLLFKSTVQRIKGMLDLFRHNNRLNEWKWFISALLCEATVVLVMGFYFIENIGVVGGVLIGNVFLLYKYLENIQNLFERFTSMYSDIVRYKANVSNAEELSKDFIEESFSNHVLPKNWKRLDIQNLSFSYNNHESTDPHLNDISLSIHHGENIAFVGESGSGKTTLLKIMRDLHHPSNLNLSVEGVLIPHGFDGISRAIALVPQNPEIFTMTIEGNITLGAEYPMEVIEYFSNMACFTSVVQNLPHQYESQINEKGVNLSGGQQQRLALVRGLLACADKDIVLLDEPTSSLDTPTEAQVYENIFRKFKDKTIISSIHRLHLLPEFDYIYIFDKGRIVSSGTFDVLLRECVIFQKHWKQYNERPEEV